MQPVCTLHEALLNTLTQRSAERCSGRTTFADIQYPQFPRIPQIITQVNRAKRKQVLPFTGQHSHYCRFSGCRISLLCFPVDVKVWS